MVKRRGRSVGLYQPYEKGTLEHQFLDVINGQGLEDSILGPMCGISRSTLNNYRTGRRTPSLEVMKKVADRCGYSIRFVRKKGLK